MTHKPLNNACSQPRSQWLFLLMIQEVLNPCHIFLCSLHELCHSSNIFCFFHFSNTICNINLEICIILYFHFLLFNFLLIVYFYSFLLGCLFITHWPFYIIPSYFNLSLILCLELFVVFSGDLTQLFPLTFLFINIIFNFRNHF